MSNLKDRVAAKLTENLRDQRKFIEENLAIRLHRALSWLKCAHQYDLSDPDVAYITAWVSFNSCYEADLTENLSERDKFNTFIEQLCFVDTNQEIYSLLWKKYSQFIRLLINNKYIFSPFWTSVRENNEDWVKKFKSSNDMATHALKENDTALLLKIVLDRLYVLRNQILHGGATHKSKVNREQVMDGKAFLLEIMPILIKLMLENAQKDWGEIRFPIIES